MHLRQKRHCDQRIVIFHRIHLPPTCDHRKEDIYLTILGSCRIYHHTADNTMKLLLGSFLTLALTSTASAALDCDVQIGRAVDPSAVCAHFEGIEAGPYRAWYNDFGIESKYTSMVYLQGSDPTQPQNGAAIHWKVDEEYVHIAVAARATGWVAFGIAEAGGMLGADMALFGKSTILRRQHSELQSVVTDS